MKLHLIYPGGLQYQPQWWQNFINDIDVQYIHQPRTIERTTNIHTEIKKAGAKPFYTNPEDISSIIGLEFDRDADATWFLLKWGSI